MAAGQERAESVVIDVAAARVAAPARPRPLPGDLNMTRTWIELCLCCALAGAPAWAAAPDVTAPGAPVFVKRPTLVSNGNLRAPLAGILRFTADQPVTTIVRLTDSSRRWEMEFDESWDPVAGIPILGLRAD